MEPAKGGCRQQALRPPTSPSKEGGAPGARSRQAGTEQSTRLISPINSYRRAADPPPSGAPSRQGLGPRQHPLPRQEVLVAVEAAVVVAAASKHAQSFGGWGGRSCHASRSGQNKQLGNGDSRGVEAGRRRSAVGMAVSAVLDPRADAPEVASVGEEGPGDRIWLRRRGRSIPREDRAPPPHFKSPVLAARTHHAFKSVSGGGR